MSNFDDLQFSTRALAANINAACLACQDTRVVCAGDVLCPTCGMRLQIVDADAASVLDGIARRQHERWDAADDAGEPRATAATAGGDEWYATLFRSLLAAQGGGSAAPPAGGGSLIHMLPQLAAAAVAASAPPPSDEVAAQPLVAGEHSGPAAVAIPPDPSTAEQMFAAAVASMFGHGGGGGGGGDYDPGACPAAPEAVRALRRIAVTDPAADLPRACSLRVLHSATGLPLVDCVPVPALFCAPDFGDGTSQLQRAFRGRLVAALPFDCGGGADMQNASELAGSFALVERGGVTFARKALKAQAAGAIGVVCIQTADVWPYMAADSTGELAAGGSGSGGGITTTTTSNLRIPFVMVRREDAGRLKAAAGSAAVLVFASASDHECPICCDAMSAGCTAAVMPCQHVYHEHCIEKWLSRRNTCPLCRCPLPAASGPGGEGGSAEALRQGVAQITEQWYR